MELVFLGTGTSNGVPEIGCHCPVCTSLDPRNKRYRSSIFVRTGECNILIDTSPDFRMQALEYNVDRVDAVCYTHHHADHVFGIDELRRFNIIQGERIPCYVGRETKEVIERVFDYIFNPNPRFQSYIPKLDIHLINGRFSVGTTEIIPVKVLHGGLQIYGFRIDKMAYLTDCNDIPVSSMELLEDLEVLVLDALRPSYHISHFSLDNAIAAAQRIGAVRTFFTHIAHDINYEETSKILPERIQLAYDGLTVTW